MRFAGIMENDFTDGIGICVSFWTQGCPYHCNGCQNPQTWDFNGGSELPDNYIDIIIKLLHKRFKHNLSILGGEPLCADGNRQSGAGQALSAGAGAEGKICPSGAAEPKGRR